MILTFDNVNFFFKFIRQFLASIDVVVFSLLSWIIEGVFNLSSLMLSTDFAKQIYTRIYIILGVFMAFKLTFSFLKYLASPDAMTDKEQGVGKLIGRVVAMIIMLIAFPIVFFNPVPGDSQNRTVLAILQDGVVKTLPRIILGQAIGDTNASGSVNAKDNGKELALSMLKSFYYPSVCNEDSKNYDRSKTSNCGEYFAGKSTTISDKGLESTGIDSFSKFYNSVLNEAGNDTYAYQYMWPLTTVTGILLIVIMAGICIDIAIRCFKLLILEVMAPVPIMTYIDPKASKDGSFAAWSKTLISTYIDLFVKLGTVYLVLLLASALFRQELFDKAAYNNFSGLSYLYVQVFLVIGLFQFAKQAPKFIKDALGIKDNGGSGGFMGKAFAGMAGAAAGFAGGVAGGGGIMGGLSAAAGGFSAGAANAGSGKPLGMYSKSRDEMAKSTGKIPGGVVGRIRQNGFNRQANKAGYQDILADEKKLKENIQTQSGEKNASDRELANLRSQQANKTADVNTKRDALTLANQNAIQARANMSSGMYKQVQDDLDYARANGISEADAVASMPDDVLASYNAYKNDMSLINAADTAQTEYDTSTSELSTLNNKIADEQDNNIRLSQDIQQSQQYLQDVQKDKDKVEKGYNVYKSKKESKTPTKKNPYTSGSYRK